MPSIASGSSVTVTVGENDFIKLGTTGIAAVEAVTGAGVPAGVKLHSRGGTSIAGPFGKAGTVKISAIGAVVSYALNLENPGAQILDAFGLPAAVSSGTGSAIRGIAAEMESGVSLLGCYGPSFAANETTVTTSTVSYNEVGVASWLQFLSGGRLWMPLVVSIATGPTVTQLVNYAVGYSGQSTVTLLANVQAYIDGLQQKPRYVLLPSIDTNDYAIALTIGDTAKTVQDRVFAICNAFIAAGITPVLTSTFPRGSMASGASGSRPGWGTLTDTQITTARRKMLQGNQIKAQRCGVPGSGVIFVDVWARMLDPAAPTDARSTYTDSGDFIHPSALGAYQVADEVWDVLQPRMAGAPPLVYGGSSDLYNASELPFGSHFTATWIGDTGTATSPVTEGAGGLPTGWTGNRLSGAGTSGVVAQGRVRADGKAGYELHCALTGGTSTDIYRFYDAGSTIAGANAGGALGGFYGIADTQVATTGAASPPNINMRLEAVNIWALNRATSPIDVPGTYSGRLRTPVIVQDAAPNTVNAWLWQSVGATAGGDVSFQSYAVRNYDTSDANAVLWS